MKIATGQYKNHLHYKAQGYYLVAITSNIPKDVEVDYSLVLGSVTAKVQFNKKVSDLDKNKTYQRVLDKISPLQLKAELQALAVDKVVLLSWEGLKAKFSPRKALAAYLMKHLGIRVKELPREEATGIKVNLTELDDL